MTAQAERTLILGHRGAPAEAPENTLTAYQCAIDCGADGIELDVQRSADGQLVLIHDDTVDRTTNGTGTVGELPWSALGDLDAGGGERIPRLEQVLLWAMDLARQGRPPFLNLELKMPGVGPDVLGALVELDYHWPVALSSFDYPTLQETRRRHHTIDLWLLSSYWAPELLHQALAIDASCLALRYDIITTEIVERAATLGLGLVAWTVDAPHDLRRLLAVRPPLRAVISNQPGRANEERRVAGGRW